MTNKIIKFYIIEEIYVDVVEDRYVNDNFIHHYIVSQGFKWEGCHGTLTAEYGFSTYEEALGFLKNPPYELDEDRVYSIKELYEIK